MALRGRRGCGQSSANCRVGRGLPAVAAGEVVPVRVRLTIGWRSRLIARTVPTSASRAFGENAAPVLRDVASMTCSIRPASVSRSSAVRNRPSQIAGFAVRSASSRYQEANSRSFCGCFSSIRAPSATASHRTFENTAVVDLDGRLGNYALSSPHTPGGANLGGAKRHRRP
jgi:hypothetical protein